MKVQIVQERGANGKTYIKLIPETQGDNRKIASMRKQLGYTERDAGAPLQLELKQSAPEKKRFNRLVRRAEVEAVRIISMTGKVRRAVRLEAGRRSCRIFLRP